MQAGAVFVRHGKSREKLICDLARRLDQERPGVPKVARVAFDSAFAPSTMKSRSTAGSSPRSITVVEKRLDGLSILGRGQVEPRQQPPADIGADIGYE